MTLLKAVSDVFAHYGLNKTYWVAYSGGLDSHVLLSLCASARKAFPVTLRAIHINHGLSPHAASWMAHCERVCQALDMTFEGRAISMMLQNGDSVEEVARDKRYAMFAECLGDDDVLLTAHQQDDQAETLLLQLCRGAGPKGLAAMPAVKPFAKGTHLRPLLAFTRAELQDYATGQGLRWIDDESNVNVAFARNFMRHDVLPTLAGRWASVKSTLARSAALCAEAQSLLEEYAIEECLQAKGSQPETLSVSHLLQLSAAKQHLVLRTWIDAQGFPLPNAKKLQTVCQCLLTAGENRMPCVTWRGADVRRYRDDVYIMPNMPVLEVMQPVDWEMTTPLALSGRGVLCAKEVVGSGLSASVGKVIIRFRQGGESMHVAGSCHHQLKNLFQTHGIAPWLRDRVPLVYADGKLVAVVGYFMDADYEAKAGEAGWALSVKNESPLSRG